MGKKKLIGRGYIRDVYLVEWEGRQLVVKFLREDYEAKASESRVEKIHRWEAAALDAVRSMYYAKKVNPDRVTAVGWRLVAKCTRRVLLFPFFSSPAIVSVVCPTGPFPPLRLARRPNRGHKHWRCYKSEFYLVPPRFL